MMLKGTLLLSTSPPLQKYIHTSEATVFSSFSCLSNIYLHLSKQYIQTAIS